MCGLILNINNNPEETVNKKVIDTLQDQISRGKEGFGLILIDKENKVKILRSTEMVKCMLDLYEKDNQCNKIILHHRNPTSTDNKLAQTHPISVSSDKLKYDYLVIHNGSISNSEEVKKLHNKLGYEYTTEYKEKNEFNQTTETKFNDSESLAIEIARFIDKNTSKIETKGSVAFICLQINKKNEKVEKIYFGRNSSPLNLHSKTNEICLSSEGKGSSVTPNTLYHFELTDLKLKKQKIEIKTEKYEYQPTYQHPDTTTDINKLHRNKRTYREDNKDIVEDITHPYSPEPNDPFPTTTDSNIEREIDEEIDEEIEDFEKNAELIIETRTDLIIEKLTELTDKFKDSKELLMLEEKEEITEVVKEIVKQLKKAKEECYNSLTDQLYDN